MNFPDNPIVSVGIMRAPVIELFLHGCWRNGSGGNVSGALRVSGITQPLVLQPCSDDCRFTLNDVTIGIDFHWQRRENQIFSGAVELRPVGDGSIRVVNTLPVEDYLLSVISSEMSAEASEEFLCAHAVISRSWLLAQMQARRAPYPGECSETAEETVRWQDHQSHVDFHVCADDHCQRYQGVARSTTPQVRRALQRTAGEVLLDSKGDIADARFSKCCGGMTEEFATCWQPIKPDYLRALPDNADGTLPLRTPADEAGAAMWIDSRPDSFCANPSPAILRQVLNDYDRSTTDFYRWHVTYTADELAQIIRSRSGRDFGEILALEPLHRGPSGRIDRLRIVGTRMTHIVGKELEIRRRLSTSHLYSSAFVATPHVADERGIPSGWTLRGAGWGHGVGLCQIGAAVMAERGYSYTDILAHYFPGARIFRAYH